MEGVTDGGKERYALSLRLSFTLSLRPPLSGSAPLSVQLTPWLCVSARLRRRRGRSVSTARS